MLGKLDAGGQARLTAAMAEIEMLVGGTPPANADDRPSPILREPKHGDSAGSSNVTPSSYAQEYGWGDPFEGLCAQIVADFVNNYDAKLERCWIAELNARTGSARSCW